MNRDGALDKFDISNDRIREELFERIWADDGLFFFSTRILGRKRIHEKVHRNLAIWYKKQYMVPNALISVKDTRGSGKSTMLVEDWCPYVLLHHPIPGSVFRGLDSRIALIAPKVTLAGFRVDGVKKLIDSNPALRALAGDILKPDPTMYSAQRGLRFLRPGLGGEPNILPAGLESILTQLHPIIAIIDDAVHEKNWKSPVELMKSKMCVDLAYNLVKSEQGVRAVIGNIWAEGDVQDELRPSNPKYTNVRVWERGLTCCPECVNGRTNTESQDALVRHVHRPNEIAPEERTFTSLLIETPDGSMREMLEEEAMEVYTSLPPEMSSAQYDNFPQPPGDTLLDASNLHLWEWSPQGDAIMVGIDPKKAALGGPNVLQKGPMGGATEFIPFYQLDCYILLDPASSVEEGAGRCKFAMAVVGVERSGRRVFLLDEYAKNAPPHVNYDAVLDAFLKWNHLMPVKKIGYESVGYQSTVGDGIMQRALVRDIRTLPRAIFEPIPRLRSEGAQMDRIRYTLQSMFTSGQVYIHRNHPIFVMQVKRFGVQGALHDLLDAFSNISRVYTPRRSMKGSAARLQQATMDRMKNAGVTGYGG